MQKIYFFDGKAVTKTQLLNEAETKTRMTKSKNKRRLRESLTFRFASDYSDWGKFIGNCQPIGYKSVSHVSLEGIIEKALAKDNITEPCVAVFRLNHQNFIYSDGSLPVIFNGHILVDRGGSWQYYIENDGYLTWYVDGADADRFIHGEYLLTEEIPFPRMMSLEDRKSAIEKYGQLYDRYHIIPDYSAVVPTKSEK